ncbi:hypothetical protein A0257_21430 [Hymenobacter psoromatis]|nr:hypothetical protein A0257_21430 [Hymenobacter psoromatis]
MPATYLRCLSYLALLLAVPFWSLAQAPADAALGTWLTESKDVKMRLFRCGDKLCGKIAWMQQPNEANGQPKRDLKNPDPTQRSQPQLNATPMRDFTYDGHRTWADGKLYDGRTGREYSGKLTLVSQNELEVRGYVGFSLLGKSTTWTRVP